MNFLLWSVVGIFSAQFPMGGVTFSAPVGMSVTVHEGGVTYERADGGGDTDYLLTNKFTTPATITSPTFPDAVVNFSSVDSGTPDWGMVLYNSSGTLLCSKLVTSVAANGWNTVSWSGAGCPTPVASTTYYVGVAIASATQNYQVGGITQSVCPNSGQGTAFTNVALTSFPLTGAGQTNGFPNSLPTSTANVNGCYTFFEDLSYTTTAPITVVSYGFCAEDADLFTQTCNLAPTGSGHGLQAGVITYTENGSTNYGTMVDSAAESLTKNGTCTGTLINNAANCLYSIDRVSSGVSSVTFTTTDTSTHNVIMIVETAGTAATGSLDANAADTAAHATPFTGPNLVTSFANEFLLCLAQNTQFQALSTSPATWTPGTGWSQLAIGQNNSASSAYVFGVFGRFVSSTGTYNCAGSYSIAGTDNITTSSTYH